MNGRLGLGSFSGHISPRQLAGPAVPVVAQVPSPGPSTSIDKARLAPNGGALQAGMYMTRKGLAVPAGAMVGAPAAPGSPGTPGGPSVLPPSSGAIVPQTVGTASWPMQWQTQQNYQQQTVSVPVTLVTQPQLSEHFSPAQPSGDLGPMGPVEAALGLEAGNSSRCLTYAILGMGLAWLLGHKKAG